MTQTDSSIATSGLVALATVAATASSEAAKPAAKSVSYERKRRVTSLMTACQQNLEHDVRVILAKKVGPFGVIFKFT